MIALALGSTAATRQRRPEKIKDWPGGDHGARGIGAEHAAVVKDAVVLLGLEDGIEFMRFRQPLAAGADHQQPVRRLLDEAPLRRRHRAQQLGEQLLVDRPESAARAEKAIGGGRREAAGLEDRRQYLVDERRP
jgi:hypothetical protein